MELLTKNLKTMRKATLAFAIFISISGLLYAQEKPTKPGDTTLVSTPQELEKLAAFDNGNYKYSVADYFSKPQQSGFQFSPNGKYFSYREKDENGKRHIYVKNIETNEVTRVITEGNEL
jgi:hypothetical protein